MHFYKIYNIILTIREGKYGKKEILNFIEDKDIQKNTNWYIHATNDDIGTIKHILNEGIKCSYLMNKKGNHFNGKYYVSVYKENNNKGLNRFLISRPKFIIDGIAPYYADRKKIKFRRIFVNTRIPLRTSEWDGEFQQYLKIGVSHIVALEYSLAHLLTHQEKLTKEKIQFLKDVVIYLETQNVNLPIFDFSSSKEINKEKLLSLKI